MIQNVIKFNKPFDGTPTNNHFSVTLIIPQSIKFRRC